MKLLSAITAIGGCVSLYFAEVMMLMVPGEAGENYLSRMRIEYGVAPLILSLGLLALAGWFWSRAVGSSSVAKYIERAVFGGFGLVALFWVGLIVFSRLRGWIQ